jgi:ATP-dependent DNA helicase RecG
MELKIPLPSLGRVFKSYAGKLERLNITTLEDLLYHIPFRYDDYSLISKIAQVQPGETVTIQGQVTEIKNEFTKKFKKLQKATIVDNTGSIEATWFNQPFLTNIIHPGDNVSLSGRVGFFARKIGLQTPDYEVIEPGQKPIHTGRLVPIYPETYGVTSKFLRRYTYKFLHDYKESIIDFLPEEIISRNQFVRLYEALVHIHFPDNFSQVRTSRDRLAFDELFLLQLAALKRRTEWEQQVTTHIFTVEPFKHQIDLFFEKLPFELTGAQKKAVADILKDFSSTRPMNRLLEGDVGSGKTVVAAIAMYVAFLNGFQSVLMAPTEILAQQHYATVMRLLEPLGVRIGIATGSKKEKIKEGEFDMLVGTHAVLSENINFKKLGLVVIDEQQRFGVKQRGVIRGKGENPHLLTMTATPIPRTVALTMYGDLDLSYLDEMPKGRKIIKTWLVPEEKRDSGYKWIEEQIKTTDSQAFVICPFIEESESMQTVKAAAVEFERLQKDVFPNLKLGLLHGRLKGKEKDKVLEQFRNREFDILVATPVVEVGIDIPNATIIVIEAAERFGLAQLHQLRGRVGRGDKQSYCLLFTESVSDTTQKRLKAMETMHVGAELAELDLKLRGPGEVFGTQQHGKEKLKVATFMDFGLIEKAKHEAEKIFPELNSHPLLVKKLEDVVMKEVSPD